MTLRLRGKAISECDGDCVSIQTQYTPEYRPLSTRAFLDELELHLFKLTRLYSEWYVANLQNNIANIRNEFYAEDLGIAEGFRYYKNASTLVKYITILKQILVHYYRVIYCENSHFTRTGEIKHCQRTSSSVSLWKSCNNGEIRGKTVCRITSGDVPLIIQGIGNKPMNLARLPQNVVSKAGNTEMRNGGITEKSWRSHIQLIRSQIQAVEEIIDALDGEDVRLQY